MSAHIYTYTYSALLLVRITTARRPDHIRLSALVRSRSTQFIVHASSQLDHGPLKRGHFPAILAGLCKKEARQKSLAVATSRRVKEAATLHLTNQAPFVSNIHNRHNVKT